MEPAPIDGLDKLIGVLCLVCLVLGTPANILSFLYFRKQHSSAPSVVYSVISLSDTWICFNGYPVATLFLNHRAPGLFGDYTYRQLWGLTWEPFPYFSVFLVITVSLTRTIKIVAPMVPIRRKHVLIPIISYATFLIIRHLIGVAFFGKYELDEQYPIYPWIHITSDTYSTFDLYLALVLQAFPIIPIIVSATVSMVVLMRSKRSIASTSDLKKNRATVTVLIFTLIYVLCNVPFFLCSLRFAIWKLSDWKMDIFNGPSVFLNRYIWTISYITQVQLNALLNPCVYFCRMRRFRRQCKRMVGKVVNLKPKAEVGVAYSNRTASIYLPKC